MLNPSKDPGEKAMVPASKYIVVLSLQFAMLYALMFNVSVYVVSEPSQLRFEVIKNIKYENKNIYKFYNVLSLFSYRFMKSVAKGLKNWL